MLSLTIVHQKGRCSILQVGGFGVVALGLPLDQVTVADFSTCIPFLGVKAQSDAHYSIKKII